MTYKIDVENGKYTFINNNGVVDILRNGEIWGSGNKAILALLYKVEQYEKALTEIFLIHNYNGLKAKGIAEKALKE